MKHLLFLGIIIALLFQGIAISQNGFSISKPKDKASAAQPLLFLELWNSFAFYDTNLEKKNFSSLLGRFEGKAGFNLFDYPLQTYAVYYGAASQINDYWDNYLFSGGGIRLIPFRSYQGTGWYNEWLKGAKIFVESLSSSYLKNAASAEAANLKKTDLRYGVDVWYEWNLDRADEALPWGELWANFSIRSTNFTTLESNSYLLYFQPKIGRHLGKGIEIYLRGDLTYSDRNDYWLNMADYGIGLRFEPWREGGAAHDLFKKFKMFAEVLGVSYLKDKPAEANKEISSDLRFGIDFSYGR